MISASSKVITSMPPVLYAGDARIFGTHVARNLSAETSPPGRPSLQGMSWPSSQTFGVMKERFGVFAADERSDVSTLRPTTSFAHAGESMIEWKYTKGS